MVKDYGITEQDARRADSSTKTLADQFEAAAKAAKNPKRVANLVQSELMGRLKAESLEIEQSPITMQGVAMSADLVETGAISGKMLKDLYDLSLRAREGFLRCVRGRRAAGAVLAIRRRWRRSLMRSSPPIPSRWNSTGRERRR